MQPSAGYREIEHTADWALEVWAPDLAALFEQAARGMYALSGMRLATHSRSIQYLQLSAFDAESLLVKFLGELLYLGEQRGLGFDTFALQIDGDQLCAELGGAPIAAVNKEIKAVTYHNLAIHRSPRGLEVSIVFDV